MDISKLVIFKLAVNDAEYIVELRPRGSYKLLYVKGAGGRDGWSYIAGLPGASERFEGLPTIKKVHNQFSILQMRSITLEELFVAAL